MSHYPRGRGNVWAIFGRRRPGAKRSIWRAKRITLVLPSREIWILNQTELNISGSTLM